MSAVPPGEAASQPDKKQTTKRFRKFNAAARLSPDQSRRQNEVLQSAHNHFGVSGAMIAFLNTQNEQLEGSQPLHLAIQSDEGLKQVKRLLGDLPYQA